LPIPVSYEEGRACGSECLASDPFDSLVQIILLERVLRTGPFFSISTSGAKGEIEHNRAHRIHPRCLKTKQLSTVLRSRTSMIP
jgi:hypothetical protein